MSRQPVEQMAAVAVGLAVLAVVLACVSLGLLWWGY